MVEIPAGPESPALWMMRDELDQGRAEASEGLERHHVERMLQRAATSGALEPGATPAVAPELPQIFTMLPEATLLADALSVKAGLSRRYQAQVLTATTLQLLLVEGTGYRLPTREEWVWAATAGGQMAAGEAGHPWGLRDLAGGVGEWTFSSRLGDGSVGAEGDTWAACGLALGASLADPCVWMDGYASLPTLGLRLVRDLPAPDLRCDR